MTYGVGIVILIGLVYLFRFVRNHAVNVEIEQMRAKENARLRNKKAWDELTSYPDVRKLRSAHERQSHAPSYFDFTGKV